MKYGSSFNRLIPFGNNYYEEQAGTVKACGAFSSGADGSKPQTGI